MLNMLKIILLFNLSLISVECLIDLSVQKVNRKLIQRKRQDTLDMCRLFTAENERAKQHELNNHLEIHNGIIKPKRTKRDVTTAYDNSVDEAERVESIVDRLYDDVKENGERVTYRRKNLESTAKKIKDRPARRFNFAPAELLGPKPEMDQPQNISHDDVGNGITWSKRWKHGIVPYFIDSKTYDIQLSDIIVKAFDYFEKATCIRLQRLRERPTDKESLQSVEWLYITNPSGIRQCVHSNEKKVNRGVQMVVFGYDCLSLGEVVHEVMHVLGFSHEHTRPDRDQHITVLWDNIKPGYKKYFEIRANDPLLGIPYDYSSVLHYPQRAFSKNGQVTMVAESGIKLGQREGLSESDVEKISMIYGNECVERNRQYLLNTCPSVVKTNAEPIKATQEEIVNYFKDRLWPYGIVNYKIKDKLEFSAEEKENIKAVIRHIEKETCIKFREIVPENDSDAIDDLDNLNTEQQNNPEDITNTNNNDSKESNINGVNTLDTPNSIGNDLEESKKIQEDKRIISNEITEEQPNNNDADNSDAQKSRIVNFGLRRPEKGEVNILLPDDIRDIALRKLRRVRRESKNPTPSRRHAESILTLTRSAEPGCLCPSPGKPTSDKNLVINTDCFNSVNDLLHLFVHVLGLDHQHNTHDRDLYLHIVWDQITPEIKDDLMNVLPPAASVGFPYDYQSVMHYPWLQIKNGVTNMMYPIWNDGWAMGHWQGLSSTDVQKLNLIYFEQCQDRRKQGKADQ